MGGVQGTNPELVDALLLPWLERGLDDGTDGRPFVYCGSRRTGPRNLTMGHPSQSVDGLQSGAGRRRAGAGPVPPPDAERGAARDKPPPYAATNHPGYGYGWLGR